ncbi:ParB/RepB/Spo0J family partition protein (plasmid) [Streptomyces sp. FXJ1.172]|uniref:ParB/RepB/Spo0J family partition protein n=1 Tax=Streptomyces sp. FXJ1.172 TaxID=710705 RepID=UPI0023DD1E97|nr:ParB/RepB/Spo0J family partition protein [Streptomyces sp. FXJ1.172]WEP00790.1 ParB/RepB/Spo0J family partition protein [Streptomyces sp. FXJ1.172]
MSGTKKKDWNDLLGSSNTSTQSPADSKESPATVLMHTIVGNPANPRPEEDYTDDDPEFRELKASMKEIGQLQPLAVVSRPVFEKAKHEIIASLSAKVRKLIGEADWVVVTGNRRLAAARQLGWTRIDIRVQNQLGDEDGRIDEAVIIENIHRKAIAPIREANYLQGMLKRYGSQEKVAERIGKSQVYVSQRLALLKLAPDLQDEVEAGTLKIKEARQLAGQTENHEEQRTRAADLKRHAAEPKPSRAPARKQVQNPVLNQPATADATPDGGSDVAPVQNPVLSESRDDSAPAQNNVPEPREASAAESSDRQPAMKMFPYHDGTEAGNLILFKMPPEERDKVCDMLLRDREKRATSVS